MVNARRLLRAAVTVTLVASTACGSWHAQGIAPAHVISVEQPTKVRLRLLDGRRLDLTAPTMAGDTIVGTNGRYRHEIPLSVVKALELHRSGSSAGALAGVLSVLGLGLIVAFVATYNQ